MKEIIPQKIYNTFISNGIKDLSKNTVVSYLDLITGQFFKTKKNDLDMPQVILFLKIEINSQI